MKRILSNISLACIVTCQLGQSAANNQPSNESVAPSDLNVGISKSIILENPVGVKRLAVTNPDVAEAVAVSKGEVIVNGKAAGDTTLVIWDLSGKRTMFDLHVLGKVNTKPEDTRRELQKELPGQDVSLDLSEGNVFLRGTVNDPIAADRAAAIASTLGKVVNLLKVKVADADPQILLKVRFANVERTALSQLGLNLVSTGATNTIGAVSTRQFGSQPTFDFTQNPNTYTFNDLLNIFFFRKDLNLGGTIQAMEAKNLVQILAEPNLLTVSGKQASFLAGGEFPFPTLQGGGAGVGQITIQFREFGVRVNFLPVITPRGTIRLSVTPEVSSLDYANGLTVSGYTVPGLATRRVQTEVELDNGQSFAIAGLLDNRITSTLNKIPGLSEIPLLGKLFESRQLQKNNSELLVVITPVIVRPIEQGTKAPELQMPKPPMKDSSPAPLHNPELPLSDPAAHLPRLASVPVELTGGVPQSAPASDKSPAPAGVKPLFQLTPGTSDTNTGSTPPASPTKP